MLIHFSFFSHHRTFLLLLFTRGVSPFFIFRLSEKQTIYEKKSSFTSMLSVPRLDVMLVYIINNCFVFFVGGKYMSSPSFTFYFFLRGGSSPITSQPRLLTGFKTLNEHIRVSSTVIIAPALSNSPQ